MCGLAGIFDTKGEAAIDFADLQAMNNVLTHRGPDGDGIHTEPGLGLAHRRLSIIDIEGGAQPLWTADRRQAVVFNGEIYNFRRLRKELESTGHRFRTNSDTESILHAWRQWGPECVERLEGMFAFALWDTAQQILFLARDRLGKKPIYHATLPDGRFVFASELKALMQLEGLNRDIDPTAACDYFAFGYVPDPKTIYKSVRKLPPAHSLLWRRGGEPQIRRYWQIRYHSAGPTELEEAVEELDRLLSEAVEDRMVADVPLGAFLSGGVDSSGVVAHMAAHSDRPVKTFSIGFDCRDFDETPMARRMAEHARTEHRVETVDPDAIDLVNRLAGIYDEPFGDSSAIPTFRVSAAARKGVKVALSGDGGDELFAGYRRYLWHAREERIRHLLPATVRSTFFGLLGRIYPKLDWAPRFLRAKTTLGNLALDEATAYFASVSTSTDAERAALFSGALQRDLNGYDASAVIRHEMNGADSSSPYKRLQAADMAGWLPGDILVKVDRASMANSLEVRAPLLDYRLFDWAAGLPDRMRVRSGEGKYVLKKALESRVPRDLLYRRKQGFSVPLVHWFRGPLRNHLRTALSAEAFRDTGLFEPATIDRWITEHQRGIRDHSRLLWLLLMFAGFINVQNVGAGDRSLTDDKEMAR